MDITQLQGAGPWPLDPTELESPVPNGILLDIALAGPYPGDVLLDTVVWGGPMWGVCATDSNRVPLAWLWMDSEPEAGVPYGMEGSGGWTGSVMFGRHPSPVSLLGLGLLLDPRCVAAYDFQGPPGPTGETGETGSGYMESTRLVVDGVEYPAPPGGVLGIESLGYALADVRDGVLVLSRADALLDETSRWSLFQESPESNMEVFSIAGVRPDSSGNILIRLADGAGTASIIRERPQDPPVPEGYVDPDYVDPDYIALEEYDYSIPVGVVLDGAPDPGGFLRCGEAELAAKLKCRTEMGVPTPLPLDYVNCPGLGVPVCD